MNENERLAALTNKDKNLSSKVRTRQRKIW